MKYNVIFIQQYEYIVEAENDEEAFKKGYKDFIRYMPTDYDDVIIEQITEE